MADTMHHTEGSWIGLGITVFLGIIARITLNDVALICTSLAGLATFSYTIWKWIKNK